jgi:hypothetical protein
MYQALYTAGMQPVNTGDVVHFSNRTWSIDEVCNSSSYLDCWIWVRSMDEQHLCIRVTGNDFGARFIQTR